MSLSSVEYVIENSQESIKLTPISIDILESVFHNNVTILFSQGPLNLIPIISSLFANERKQDVLVGFPKTLFHERFEKNTDIFLSLIYRKKIGAVASKALYFYYDMLWCKGEIDEETNELIKLDISTRPKHGTLKSKRDYDNYARDSLTSGTFKTRPKILSIPIDELTPAGITDEKPIIFEKHTYILNNFDPKLVIYDSINERKYSFDNIFNLINKAQEKEIKLLLHFSWPYLKGLSAFLKKIDENSNVNVIHLGKRICIESQKKFEKPKSNILPLSLEGESWEIYYPSRRFLNFKIVLPALKVNSNNLSAKDIEYWDWHFDDRITEIRNHLRYENFGKYKENLLRFPPIIDTFLCPSELKIGVTLKDNSWTSIPINEFISIKENENSGSIKGFKGLCSDLERCRDFSYEFKGLYTNSAITKKTLFQAFFIEKINQLMIQELEPDPNNKVSTYIFIANLHPYLRTQKSLTESLVYLFKSIDYYLKSFIFTEIQKIENSIYIKIELFNKYKLNEIIWKNNSIQDSNINNIKRFFLNNFPDVDVCIIRENNQLKLSLRLNLSFDYFEWQSKSLNGKRLRLVIYDFIIKDNGSFYDNRLFHISFEPTLRNSVGTINIEHKNHISPIKTIHKEIKIVYTDLSNIQAFSEGLKKNPSELIIPGPIPFTTISEGDILISHGYDALLLPFENVIFFAYPGYNFRNILKQTKIYNDLLSEKENTISKIDLLFSIHYTRNVTRFTLPPKPELNSIQPDGHEIDTPIDTAIREELLDDSNVDDNEREEIRTLKEIWNNIKKNPAKFTPTRQQTTLHPKENINLCVKFEPGAIEMLSFPIGTLIRKKSGEDYILTPIDEIFENDQIIYIQTDERESIENYLLKTLEDEMSIEEILEPLMTLKTFYDTFKKMDFKKDYDETKVKKLYWLSIEQKQNLFSLFRVLLNKDPLKLQEATDYVLNSIWKGLINPETLFDIFDKGNKKITYSKLYQLAVKMGFNYTEDYMKILCFYAINNQKHYYFLDDKNLLAIGRLIGHNGIIENYQIINDKGRKIRTFLQLVGFSIKRVTNDEGEPFNDMDNAIESKLKKCTVIKMGGC